MISVIIPHYPKTQELNKLLDECRSSISGYDELVLVINEGIGFAKACNWGFKMAKGDYLVLVSNDVVFKRGNIKDLIDERGVTSPLLNGVKPPRGLWGCCFCIPRWVYEQIGGFDEQFEIGYFEDDDYAMRLKLANIPLITKENVEIVSEGGKTMKEMNHAKAYGENKVKFLAKYPNAELY